MKVEQCLVSWRWHLMICGSWRMFIICCNSSFTEFSSHQGVVNMWLQPTYSHHTNLCDVDTGWVSTSILSDWTWVTPWRCSCARLSDCDWLWCLPDLDHSASCWTSWHWSWHSRSPLLLLLLPLTPSESSGGWCGCQRGGGTSASGMGGGLLASCGLG